MKSKVKDINKKVTSFPNIYNSLREKGNIVKYLWMSGHW